MLVVVLSYWPARNLISRRQRMNASFNPLHLVNSYGAFGSITKVRYEVVIEGTEDPDPGPGSAWREYEFKGKPGDPRRRPPQFAPYHLRLDWLMWFAGLSSLYAEPWIVPLAERLLENDRAILRLLRHNPFPGAPPAVVRARLYRYRFTTWQERRETGRWWDRTLVREYLPPLGLRPTAGATPTSGATTP
ncbi:lipase maturation factor family protein [Actinoallomurus soli]|uniref:lipase maturation factor family protein n=1 Tax=Actinoallomurus soli TaxID=2952535 RepID=UPI002092DB08|nr:lipase maturation factor family protein [Actinoallomurus soli]MCO5967606.1 lipase maturation factor family protein [Actinoallomurus soli]